MKRMFEVSTWMYSCWLYFLPPRGVTLAGVPSMIFSSACCTPSPPTSRGALAGGLRGVDALVVVVDGDREDLLGAVLPDHVVVEEGLDLHRRRQGDGGAVLLPLALLGDDVVAELDALVADVDGGAGDELP